MGRSHSCRVTFFLSFIFINPPFQRKREFFDVPFDSPSSLPSLWWFFNMFLKENLDFKWCEFNLALWQKIFKEKNLLYFGYEFNLARLVYTPICDPICDCKASPVEKRGPKPPNQMPYFAFVSITWPLAHYIPSVSPHNPRRNLPPLPSIASTPSIVHLLQLWCATAYCLRSPSLTDNGSTMNTSLASQVPPPTPSS